jgi:hypothetical protein
MTFEEMSMQEATNNAVKNRLLRKKDSKEEHSALLETSIKTESQAGVGRKPDNMAEEESIKESGD